MSARGRRLLHEMHGCVCTQDWGCRCGQWSSTVLAPGTVFVEENLSMDWCGGGGVGLGMIQTLHLLFTLFLL